MKDTKRLERLLNKEFIYKQENIEIKDYFVEEENDLVRVITNKKPIVIKMDEVVSFCDSLLPVEAPETVAVRAVSVIDKEVVDNTNNLLGTLQQTLLDNIALVKKDGNYIKQANTINSSVNSLIGLAKIQLNLAKMNAGKKPG